MNTGRVLNQMKAHEGQDTDSEQSISIMQGHAGVRSVCIMSCMGHIMDLWEEALDYNGQPGSLERTGWKFRGSMENNREMEWKDNIMESEIIEQTRTMETNQNMKPSLMMQTERTMMMQEKTAFIRG